MPRYFFHYHQGEELSPDDQGLEFDSVEAAYLSAYKGALDMWSELMRMRLDPRDSAFEVTDAQNRQMFVLPFAEVLDSCKSADRRSEVHDVKPTVRRVLERTKACRLNAQQSLTNLQNELFVTRRMMWESRNLIRAVDDLTRELGE